MQKNLMNRNINIWDVYVTKDYKKIIIRIITKIETRIYYKKIYIRWWFNDKIISEQYLTKNEFIELVYDIEKLLFICKRYNKTLTIN